jgi:hypothetical protein
MVGKSLDRLKLWTWLKERSGETVKGRAAADFIAYAGPKD